LTQDPQVLSKKPARSEILHKYTNAILVCNFPVLMNKFKQIMHFCNEKNFRM